MPRPGRFPPWPRSGPDNPCRAAVLLIYGNAQQPHITQLAPQVHGELIALSIFGARGQSHWHKIEKRCREACRYQSPRLKFQAGIGSIHRSASSIGFKGVNTVSFCLIKVVEQLADIVQLLIELDSLSLNGID